MDFINNAEEELRKSTDEINLNKLDSVLEHAVRAGTTSQDMFHADVTCELQTSTLPTSLRRINKQGEGPASGLAQQPVQGLDSFALHYKVSWPVSLIISPQAVAKYQLLFRLTPSSPLPALPHPLYLSPNIPRSSPTLPHPLYLSPNIPRSSPTLPHPLPRLPALSKSLQPSATLSRALRRAKRYSPQESLCTQMPLSQPE